MSTQALQSAPSRQKVHDARDGFHDIKPATASGEYPLWILIPLIVFLLFMLRRFFRRRERTAEARKPKAVSAFLQELTQLSSELSSASVPLKAASERCAHLLRDYVYDHLRVSIFESTPQEVRAILNAHQHTAALSGDVEKMLSALERVAFAAEDSGVPSVKVLEQVKKISEFIERTAGSAVSAATGEVAK